MRLQNASCLCTSVNSGPHTPALFVTPAVNQMFSDRTRVVCSRGWIGSSMSSVSPWGDVLIVLSEPFVTHHPLCFMRATVSSQSTRKTLLLWSKLLNSITQMAPWGPRSELTPSWLLPWDVFTPCELIRMKQRCGSEPAVKSVIFICLCWRCAVNISRGQISAKGSVKSSGSPAGSRGSNPRMEANCFGSSIQQYVYSYNSFFSMCVYKNI